MSSPINAILSGTFTTDATPTAVTLPLPAGATEIELINITDFHSAAGNTHTVRAEGRAFLPTGAAILHKKDGGATINLLETMTTAAQEAAGNGFTFFTDSGNQGLGVAVAVTAITGANPAVASSASTAVVGDVVRIYGTTGQLQYSGMDFTVTAVNPGVTQTLGYLNSNGYAAATAGFMRILPFRGVALSSGSTAPDPRFYPRARYITAITQANPAVVTLSVAHSYTIGEKVRIIVPAVFGMVEMNNYLATITAVSYANNTITLDINSAGFTAFAFPLSATAAGGITFAQIIPVGEAAVNTLALPVANFLFDATRNTSISGVVIGTACLEASCNYAWIAKKGLSI
jgi:hypothetical protein